MSFIYDSESVLAEAFPILTIGSLVRYGSVINNKNKHNIGIIIGVEQYNFGIGECVFNIYSNGKIIKTSLVFAIWESS